DDHIVNIILDVTATGVLVIQREGRRDEKNVSFTLVGTMNPEEGGLRPQLLDRFGLMVNVTAETNEDKRNQILRTVLDFDRERFLRKQGGPTVLIDEAIRKDAAYREKLLAAQKRLYDVDVPQEIIIRCVQIAKEL